MALFRETALGPRPIARGGAKSVIVPTKIFTVGSHSHTITKKGFYIVSLWGGGAAGGLITQENNHTYAGGGISGAFCEKTVELPEGALISIVVGKGGSATRNGPTSGEASTASCSPFFSMSAGYGYVGQSSNNPTGIGGNVNGGYAFASGGDVNVRGASGGDAGQPGLAPVSANSGTPGPAYSGGWGGGGAAGGSAVLRGGNGGSLANYSNSDASGRTPGGGGGGGYWAMSFDTSGGDGLCILSYLGPKL